MNCQIICMLKYTTGFNLKWWQASTLCPNDNADYADACFCHSSHMKASISWTFSPKSLTEMDASQFNDPHIKCHANEAIKCCRFIHCTHHETKLHSSLVYFTQMESVTQIARAHISNAEQSNNKKLNWRICRKRKKRKIWIGKRSYIIFYVNDINCLRRIKARIAIISWWWIWFGPIIIAPLWCESSTLCCLHQVEIMIGRNQKRHTQYHENVWIKSQKNTNCNWWFKENMETRP